MFTKNFEAVMRNTFLYSGSTEFTDWGGTVFTEKVATSIANNSVILNRYCALGKCMSKISSSMPSTTGTTAVGGVYGILFGTGATPPTEEDYALESLIANNGSQRISATSAGGVIVGQTADNTYVAYADYVLQNKTSADITITEVGIVGEVCSKFTSTSSYDFRHVLLERTVLDTPMVIPAGGSKMFTYKVTFNQT